MKSLRVLIITVACLLVSSNAFGATLSYAPDTAYLTIAAGSGGTVPVTVSITDVSRTHYLWLWFIDTIEGTLPVNWITASRKTAFLNSFWSSASTNLTIAVPNDAEPGVYTGRLYSRAMMSHNYADPGSGMLISVIVSADCTSKPEVKISGFGPDVLWPPNHSMETVTVTGTATMPQGCSIYRAGYSIEDEYGTHTSEGELTVSENGKFSVFLPVEAWRKGQDKDGRIYKITLFAENEAGVGTSPVLEVLVPHDKGKRPNAK